MRFRRELPRNEDDDRKPLLPANRARSELTGKQRGDLFDKASKYNREIDKERAKLENQIFQQQQSSSVNRKEEYRERDVRAPIHGLDGETLTL